MFCGLSALLLGFLPTAYGMPAGLGIFFALSVAPAISIAISYIPGFGSPEPRPRSMSTLAPTLSPTPTPAGCRRRCPDVLANQRRDRDRHLGHQSVRHVVLQDARSKGRRQG